jgi:adenylate cyclase
LPLRSRQEQLHLETAANAVVLFADISDSTRLYELAGDAAASDAIAGCIALLRKNAAAHGGRVIKTIGDAILALFASADDAAQAAIDMQKGVAQIDPVAGIKLGIRIGFRYGPVLERGGDAFGDAVNVAARLTAQAQPQQIITSVDTLVHLSPPMRESCRQLYAIQIKGKSAAVELAELMWHHTERMDTTLITALPGRAARPLMTLRLKHGATEILFDAARSTLSMGRDKSAELVINDANASRIHCRVERRMNKYVVVDHSFNGTYITFEDNQEVLLKREELALHGHGWITLGRPRAETQEVVEFFCGSA